MNLRLDIKVCGKSSCHTTLLGTKTFSTRTTEIVSQIGAFKEELKALDDRGVGHGNIFHVRVLLSLYPIGKCLYWLKGYSLLIEEYLVTCVDRTKPVPSWCAGPIAQNRLSIPNAAHKGKEKTPDDDDDVVLYISIPFSACVPRPMHMSSLACLLCCNVHTTCMLFVLLHSRSSSVSLMPFLYISSGR